MCVWGDGGWVGGKSVSVGGGGVRANGGGGGGGPGPGLGRELRPGGGCLNSGQGHGTNHDHTVYSTWVLSSFTLPGV